MKTKYLALSIIILILLGTIQSAQSQNLQNRKLSEFIEQTERQQYPNQFQSILDSIAQYIDIHEFVLNRLFNSSRTPVHHTYFEPYIEYACNNMDSRFRDSIKSMIIRGSVYPIELHRVYNCMFESKEDACQFINSFEIQHPDLLETAFIELYIDFVEHKRSKCLSSITISNLDSFEIQKKIIEYKYELEYNEFDSLLLVLSNYGDIHNYVLKRMGESRRTEGMHEYYPAFSSFICNHMDSIYRNQIIEMINKDSIPRHHAYPFVKSCLFESSDKTCEFLINQNLEEKLIDTDSPLYESLIKLKEEMKCSM